MADGRQLRPWWERWPDWWAEQQAVLKARWGRGRGFTYFEDQHVVRWEGSVKLRRQGARRRKVSMAIIWGPATPFFPPRIGSTTHLALAHTLRDGSMCLLPPVDPERGWEGVLDIGYWLGRSEEWLRRYFDEGWGVDAASWNFLRFGLPGYRYREILPETPVVALPGSWREMTAGSGRVRVRVPATGKGVGALVAWESGGGIWQEWLAATGLVRGEFVDLPGTWSCAGEGTTPEDALRFLMDERQSKAQGAAFAEALKDGVERIMLMSMPVPGAEAGSTWFFMRRTAPNAIPGAHPLMGLMGLMGLPSDSGVGIPLHLDTLDERRKAGRSEAMHDAITSTSIVLVGLGSLGSEIAHLLAQEGVRQFLLVDGDLLLPGNEARHRGGLTHAGRPKVEVMADLIREVQPEAKVEVIQNWIDEIITQLADDGDGRTIFIGASGDEPTEHFLSDVARDMGTPCFHAWLEVGGQLVRLCRYVPGYDPTLSAAADRPETPRVTVPEDTPSPRICAATVLPGSALNIHAAANFVVRAVINFLERGAEGDNHWLFAPGGLPVDAEHQQLRQPYGVVSVRVPPE